jgi:hypothetical protein
MSLPKKKRGFRRIVVNSIDYDWRFANWLSRPCFVDIRMASKPHSKLLIDIDFDDPWLRNRENLFYHRLYPCSSPITPGFVADAIKASLNIGWQPNNTYNEFFVKYQGNQFSSGRVIKKNLVQLNVPTNRII